MELSAYREELDRIDEELIRLFSERMEISAKIGVYKKKHGLPVLDARREQKKLQTLASKSPKELAGYTEALYSLIFELSRDYQTRQQSAKCCGLLGERLGHSYSPAIHGMLADYSYELYEKSAEELPDFLKTGVWDGLNVTIPYKKTVLPYCDELSDLARRIGSVNTLVRRPDGTVYGDNTDAYGFSLLLKSNGLDPAGKKALILGSGGASVMACTVLQDLGAREVVVISRHGENNYDNLDRHADAELIVNTTPVGMFPHNGEAPVDLTMFPGCRGVVDVVYNPARTALLLQAERLGIPCAGGLKMLVAQAKRSAEQFDGKRIDDREIDRIEKALSRQMQNIVLIGMPGCGKSKVAKTLGARLGRPVYEADALIEEAAGCKIPEIFAREGEEGFRKWETQILRQLGMLSGVILSTGGGCVTREENYDLLHQNGVIFWRQRDISQLSKKGRPISQSRDLSELYRERKPLYERFADFVIEPTETVEEAAEKILEVLG